MVPCVTSDLEVPADSEIVIEGYVNPGERRREGPFGDHTGYYSLADDYPVLHVEAITMRKNPVFPATIVGRPPRRTPTWAWRPSASSCPSCAWCCRRSGTCICPPRAPSTTW